ncbi:hypothetical protein DB35_27615 [Streptomyces abyssalis]|uniref:Uncharacterized protein n=1 Tax=Streptomyces abyssalis TaxID=933944 RepID=A0A1E7JJE3_9ACTN|nr:hypothetical protein DB35_27615 [Streptomyces abyssalis]OEU87770.1 hypothetical protein AN215_15700 [Streptomyces abyssalis]
MAGRVIDSGTGAACRVRLSALLFPLLSFAGVLLAGAGLSTALTAAAASAAVLLVCHAAVGAAVAAAVPQVPRGRVRTALRDRELRTAFLPQRDPDAAGRPRPRAPGRGFATAAQRSRQI